MYKTIRNQTFFYILRYCLHVCFVRISTFIVYYSFSNYQRKCGGGMGGQKYTASHTPDKDTNVWYLTGTGQIHPKIIFWKMVKIAKIAICTQSDFRLRCTLACFFCKILMSSIHFTFTTRELNCIRYISILFCKTLCKELVWLYECHWITQSGCEFSARRIRICWNR